MKSKAKKGASRRLVVLAVTAVLVIGVLPWFYRGVAGEYCAVVNAGERQTIRDLRVTVARLTESQRHDLQELASAQRETASLWDRLEKANVSLSSDSVGPAWLIGAPRSCLGGPACDWVRRLWRQVAQQQQEDASQCPADPKAVIGCDLSWNTGLGHHVHHLGHCLTYSLIHHKPVRLLESEWVKC
jgi:hypothetical protein